MNPSSKFDHLPDALRHIPRHVKIAIDRLITAGHEAYIVGGAIRDAFLSRPVTDWDVATSANTDNIQELFRDKTCVVLKHDTVTILISGEPIEITLFKGSDKTVISDLAHRDFTVNAMAWNTKTKGLMDPHDALSDIQMKQIRAVGDPIERFQEDPVRLLRAIRLQGELGFRIEGRTLAAIPPMVDEISSVSPERIRDELIKILLSQKPSGAINILRSTGLLKRLMPELLESHLIRQNAYHRYTILKHTLMTVDRVPPDPILRLAALLHDIAKPRIRTKVAGEWRFYGHEKASARMAEVILNRLRFSRNTIHKTAHLIVHHLIDYTPLWTDAAVRRFIRRVGEENIPALLALRKADLATHTQREPALKRLRELEGRLKAQIRSHPPMGRKDLCIDGNGVMAVTGLSPGPQVGRILKELVEAVVENPGLNTQETLTDLLIKGDPHHGS
jgi:poly(A) polymerase/tRNA nucleotidyltransferase (CCA-adding enzyme)